MYHKFGLTAKSALFLLFLALVTSLFVPAIAEQFDYKESITSALNAKDTTALLEALDKEIGLDPGYAPNYFLRGKVYYNQGHFEDALSEFETALDKKSSLYEALYFKGKTLLELGRLDEAQETFEKGLKKARDQKAMFHDGMGLLYMKEGEYVKADVQFRKAITEGPDRAEYHANLGDANFYQKIYPLAISEYNTALEKDTSFLDVYFRLARAYVQQKQFNEALDQLKVVLTRDSAYKAAWKETGKLYTLAGLSASDRETRKQRFLEAIGSYRRYIELGADSSDGEVFYNLGRSYYNVGDFEEAKKALNYVLSIGDEPTQIYLYLGRAEVATGEYEDGITNLKKHLDLLAKNDPTFTPGRAESDVYKKIGDAYKELSDLPDASKSYEEALELDPENQRLMVETALVFHQMKDYPDALKYYEMRINSTPEPTWNIYLNAAYCTLNMEDLEKSTDYLKKVVELNPDDPKAYGLLSNTYLFQLKDCENGVLWTERWLEKDSTNCDALKSLGYAYFVEPCTPPNYMKAVRYFDRALACFRNNGSGNCGNTDIMLSVAQAYHLHAAALAEADKKQESKSSFKNAFDWYNKVLKCDPGNAEAKKGRDDTEFEF